MIFCPRQKDIIWYAQHHLATVPVPDASSGGRRTEDRVQIALEGVDRNCSQPAFTPDGTELFFVLEDDGATHLCALPVGRDGAPKPGSSHTVCTSKHHHSLLLWMPREMPRCVSHIACVFTGCHRRRTMCGDLRPACAGAAGSHGQVSFQWKNPDFLLRNPDFPLKDDDFIINTVRQ